MHDLPGPGVNVVRRLDPDEQKLVADGFREALAHFPPGEREIHWLNVFMNGVVNFEFPLRPKLDAWVRKIMAEAYADWPEVHLLSYGYFSNPAGSSTHQPFHCDYGPTSSNLFVPLTRFSLANATQFIKQPLRRASMDEFGVYGDIEQILEAEGIEFIEVSQLVCRPWNLLRMEAGTPHRGIPNRDDYDRTALWITVDNYYHPLLEKAKFEYHGDRAYWEDYDASKA